MKIAIDASDLTNSKAGIGYYASELIKEVLKNDKDNEYTLYTHNEKNLNEVKEIKGNFRIVEFKSERPNLKWILKVYRDLRKEKYDIFISPSYFTFGILYKNTIQIVHDLAPIKFPQFWNKKAVLSYKLLLKLCTKRTKVFAVNSNATGKDLNTYFPNTINKTFYLGAGLNEWTKIKTDESEKDRVRKKYNLPKKYILSISTLQPRKNYINAIKAFKIFLKDNPEYYYVIGGKKGWYYEEIFETVKNLELEDRVLFLGYVEEIDMPALYDLASLMLYISFEEGTGLPALEAYSRGLPVVLSDIDVHREVMKENAMFVNPNSVEKIATTITNSLSTKETAIDSQFLSKYSWKNVSFNLIQIYESFVKKL